MGTNATLGYADFLRVFNNPDPDDFAPGLEVRGSGVFVRVQDDAPSFVKSSEDWAILTEHPTGDLTQPVLAFPCSIPELEDFTEAYGLCGAILPFRLVEALQRGGETRGNANAGKSLGNRERNNLLRIVRALDAMNPKPLPAIGYAESIRRMLDQLGLSNVSDDTIRRVIEDARGLDS